MVMIRENGKALKIADLLIPTRIKEKREKDASLSEVASPYEKKMISDNEELRNYDETKTSRIQR